MDEDPIRQPMHSKSQGLVVRSTAILLILLFVAASIFFWSYRQYRLTVYEDVVRVETPSVVEPTPTVAPRAHEELLQKIEKHMTLPSNVSPEVSTVNDAQVLKESQPFFENVVIGDVLVIFDDFAVIYRESEDIIVNSGIVDNAQSSDADAGKVIDEVVSDAPGADTNVEVRNGTVINGYASRTKDKLVTLAYTIAGIGNASKKTYTETIIIKKSSASGIAVKAIETMFNTTATIDLPEGEPLSEADILIILGGAE